MTSLFGCLFIFGGGGCVCVCVCICRHKVPNCELQRSENVGMNEGKINKLINIKWEEPVWLVGTEPQPPRQEASAAHALKKRHDMDAFPLSQHMNMKKKEWKAFLQDDETKFTNRLKKKNKTRKLENRKFTRHEELLSLLHQTKNLTTTRRISVFVPSTG